MNPTIFTQNIRPSPLPHLSLSLPPFPFHSVLAAADDTDDDLIYASLPRIAMCDRRRAARPPVRPSLTGLPSQPHHRPSSLTSSLVVHLLNPIHSSSTRHASVRGPSIHSLTRPSHPVHESVQQNLIKREKGKCMHRGPRHQSSPARPSRDTAL